MFGHRKRVSRYGKRHDRAEERELGQRSELPPYRRQVILQVVQVLATLATPAVMVLHYLGIL